MDIKHNWSNVLYIKIISATATVILATEEVTRDNFKVISATTKVIMATDKLV